jgi:hypothetical protein
VSWAAGEDKRMAQTREEYQRPKGRHRAQAVKLAQAGPNIPRAHTTTLMQSPTMLTYWWCCTCGDEGGPYDHYTPAWDATVDHERGPAMSTKGEPMTLSPKQELVVTLEAAWRLLDGAEPPAVRLAQLRGLLDHARALAQRVGEMAKTRREPTA